MRIELDDVQALAFEACSDNTQTKIAEAADKAKKGQALLTEAKRIRAAAIKRMEHCWKTIASCHGLKEIPGEAQIDRASGRVVVTWGEPQEDPSSGPPVVDLPPIELSASEAPSEEVPVEAAA